MSLQMQYLREKIETARTLLGVVETMRGLAAVNLRRAEAVADHSVRYARTVHLSLHAALTEMDRNDRAQAPAGPRTPGRDPGEATWLLLSTDMGLCGQFNERIVAYALDAARRFAADAADGRALAPSTLDRPTPDAPTPPDRRVLDTSTQDRRIPGRWIVVGARGAERLLDEGARIVDRLDAPGSVEAIPGTVTETLGRLHTYLSDDAVGPLFLAYNRPDGGSAYVGRHVRLFPLEASRWERLPDGESPWRSVPMTAPGPEEMLPRLVREQVYIDLFQAFALSFAAENAARLTSMKNAADNIDELLEDLEIRYRQERQDAITTELMELLGGVEAVRNVEE